MKNFVFFAAAITMVAMAGFKMSFGCGTMTHMEVALRALENFEHTFRGLDVRQMAIKHADALRAGTVYPDSYYAGVCFKGVFADTAEASHWMPFMLNALDYFNEKYQSKPIDEEGEKLLVFILGIMAHDVADTLWHSLGIDEGFIDTMAQLNFGGSFGKSHDVADPGGDIVNLYEMYYAAGDRQIHINKTGHTLQFLKWYVPSQDMLNIYKKMGLAANETMIKRCAVFFMQVAADFERNVFHRRYQNIVEKSPFLGSNQFRDFFLGGMNEMAAWTLQRWHTLLLYMENSGQGCKMTDASGDNPINWSCGDQPSVNPPKVSGVLRHNVDRSAFLEGYTDAKLRFQAQLEKASGEVLERGGIKSIVEIIEDGKGFYLEANNPEDNSVEFEKEEEKLENTRAQAKCANTVDYFVNKAYTSIGESLVTADVNGDGFDDLIVGAPGYSFPNRFQEGRVFVILGSATGLPQSTDVNLDDKADFILAPPYRGEGRFGYAVAAVDLNADGLIDIAVSAPIFAPDLTNKMYSGQVYVYYGKDGDKRFDSANPDLTIDCDKRYCNLGTTLTSGDVDRDGKNDLIIGAPFASENLKSKVQNGFVAVYYSRKRSEKISKVLSGGADLFIQGQQAYSWLGFSVVTIPMPSPCNMLIGAPAMHNQPSNAGASAIQMAGAVYCYQKSTNSLTIFAQAYTEFAQLGTSLALGYPHGRSMAPVVAISAPGETNNGKHKKVVSIAMQQSGTIYFYPTITDAIPTNKLVGDRHFTGFGRFMKFVDTNNDGFDDFLAGAPLRQNDLSKKSVSFGRLFVFQGSSTFLQQNLARKCGDITPCLEEQADKYFALGVGKSQFGSNAAFFRSGEKTQLIVAAPRTDNYGKQSGRLVLFGDCDQ